MLIKKTEVYTCEADTAEDLRRALLEELHERIKEIHMRVRRAGRPAQNWLSLQRGMLATLRDISDFLTELRIVPKPEAKPDIHLVTKE